MRVILTLILAAGLVGVVAGAAALALPACGAQRTVWATWLEWCPVNQAAETEAQLAAITARTQDLQARIEARERELALRQCVPQQVARLAPPPAPQTPAPIERDAWENRDLAVLEGCWSLDSSFTTTDRRTGRESRYTEWEICFDRAGNGREEMRADTGTACAGTVTSQFDSAGRLQIVQPANLQCTDGAFLFRMESACTLNPNGTASCAVRQPESGGSATIAFRRSGSNN